MFLCDQLIGSYLSICGLFMAELRCKAHSNQDHEAKYLDLNNKYVHFDKHFMFFLYFINNLLIIISILILLLIYISKNTQFVY